MRRTNHTAGNSKPVSSSRERRRIGWGEYDWPDWRLSRSIGRRHFLDAVGIVEPGVLGDLDGEAYRLYAEANPERGDEEYFTFRDYLEGRPQPGDSVPERFTALHEELRAWGERWWLTAPWCHARAFETLGLWADLPDYRRQMWSHEGVQFSGPVSLDEIAFSVDNTGWNPTITTWDDFEEEFLTSVQGFLSAYHKRVEGLVVERGLVPTLEKRKVEEHYRWLARHQVRGDRTTHIANEAGRTWKAVDEAIRECAEFIDLPLRPAPRPGRPRKQ